MLKANAELKSKLNEEQLNALNEVFKDVDVVLEPQENFIPKTRFDEVNTQLKEVKTTNEKLSSDLDNAVKDSKSTEELKATIQKLQDDNKATQEKYEGEIQQRERDYLINDALREAGARNPKAAKALLDIENVKIIDGKLDGLDKQLEDLRKSDEYLFSVKQPSKDEGDKPKLDKFGNPINSSGGESDNYSDAERIAIDMGVDPNTINNEK